MIRTPILSDHNDKICSKQYHREITYGANFHLEGVILCTTSVSFVIRSSINGRVLMQTAATLQQTTITHPRDFKMLLRPWERARVCVFPQTNKHGTKDRVSSCYSIKIPYNRRVTPGMMAPRWSDVLLATAYAHKHSCRYLADSMYPCAARLKK